MSRNEILVLALVLVNILLGSLCLSVSRGGRPAPALRYWGEGLLMYALGLGTAMGGFILALPVASFVGNSLIAAAALLAVLGALATINPAPFRPWMGALLTVGIALLAYNNLVGPQRWMVNVSAPTVVAAILFVNAAWAVWRRPPVEARSHRRLLAGLLLLAVLVWSLRLTILFGVLGPISDRDQADVVAALLSIAQVLVTMSSTFALLAIHVRSVEASLTRVALSDALTGLPNRRVAMSRFGEESARATRFGQSFAMIIFDIDHFKLVNDQHGHLVGDAMLRHVSSTLGMHKREEDVLARIGGEEFMLLLLEPLAASAVQVADRLRERVANTPMQHNGKALRAQVSAGVAMYPADGRDWDTLFAVADARLYQSKAGGRNRVTGSP